LKELKTDESAGFGEFSIHKELLPEQLDELAKRLPELKENEAWVFARLRKLRPARMPMQNLIPRSARTGSIARGAVAKNL
jgi:hypothetical protein